MEKDAFLYYFDTGLGQQRPNRSHQQVRTWADAPPGLPQHYQLQCSSSQEA